MAHKRTIALVSAAALLLVGGGITAAPAMAATDSSNASHVTASARAYSDTDAVEFLALGSGRIDADHPGLIHSLGYDAPEQGYTAAQVAQLLSKVTAIDPAFHDHVTVPLQSGNPLKVERAIDAYNRTILTLAKSTGSTPDTGVHTDCVVLGVVFVVGAAVVAGAALVVVVVSTTNVTYVHNTPRAAGTSAPTDLTKQQAAASIASAL